MAVIYVIINAFNLIATVFSLIITIAIIYAQPALLKRVETQSSIQYYCVALTATLIFSVELCKGEGSLIINLLAAAGVMMISLYVGCQEILYLSVFLNIYVLSRVVTMMIEYDG
jgi:hypothetical protein